jgi:hypothetical protein
MTHVGRRSPAGPASTSVSPSSGDVEALEPAELQRLVLEAGSSASTAGRSPRSGAGAPPSSSAASAAWMAHDQACCSAPWMRVTPTVVCTEGSEGAPEV